MWKLLGIAPRDRVDDKSALTFLGSFWLEVWAWRLLSEHATELGIDDVSWGVRSTRPGGEEESDLDGAFTSAGRLLFVSCKAAAAGELQDEVFEVEARRRPLGGAFAMAMLLHWHPPTQNGSLRAVKAAGHVAPPVTVLDRTHLVDEPAFLRAVRNAIELRRD